MPINLILGLALGSPALSSVGFQLPGSLLDFDLVNNLSYPAASISSAVTFARASVAYEDDSTGVWSSFASGVMRRTNKGFLCEEVRTNGIRNSAGLGSSAGSPGTMATNWGTSNAGLTRTVVGHGVINGIEYEDIRLAGTTTGTFAIIEPDNTAAIAASPGQVWTLSVFAALVGGSLTNVTNVQTVLREVGAGGNATANMALTSTLTRQPAATRTMGASVTNVWPTVAILFASGVAVDITLRIAWPQAEQGAFATSPMRTTTVAIQRVADVATINDTASVALAGASLYLEWSMAAAAVGKVCTLWSAYVDASNYMALRIGTDNKVHFIVVNGGVTQADLVSTNVIAANTNYKAAVRWGSNDFAMRVTSSLGSPSNDVSGTVITGTPVIGLGQDGAGANQANAYIRRVAHLSTRTDAQLAALVA